LETDIRKYNNSFFLEIMIFYSLFFKHLKTSKILLKKRIQNSSFNTEMGDNPDIREPGKKSSSAINTFFKGMWHWAYAY
jgi:hypothetical protein